MTKRRLGTIQSSRPSYGLLCPKTGYMASHPAIFKGPMRGRPDNFHELAISKNGTGSRARTYDLRFWRPPLYQLSYARIVRVSAQQALPKSFRARCKERSDLIVSFLPAFSIRSEIFVPNRDHPLEGGLYGPPGTPQPQAGIGSVSGSQVSPRLEFIFASRDPHST